MSGRSRERRGAGKAKIAQQSGDAKTAPESVAQPQAGGHPVETVPSSSPGLVRSQNPVATPKVLTPLVAPDLRQRMIEEAAYYLALRRGFAPGSDLDDWMAAEREVDRLLGG